ncbi:hypothetical protein L596_028807 [Steinernema carpocapsae]|uniref:Uncharacterized protein n=1 Tax=Steinernema carpocapsae TaxID=34508 RepID=A0A4U5LZF9_STECR|nr:hypothetical protein L596_028807 [Steinernema carpocapsae]
MLHCYTLVCLPPSISQKPLSLSQVPSPTQSSPSSSQGRLEAPVLSIRISSPTFRLNHAFQIAVERF